MTVAARPPEEPGDWYCQCARCGSSCMWSDCDTCGGEGHTAFGELHDQDPLWYDEDEVEACPICDGAGGWWCCLSPYAWCKDHPVEGRENVEPGQIEWFKRAEP